MMQANELMIGNWVLTKAKRGHQLPNNLFVKVVGITNRGDIDITVDGYDCYDDIVAPNVIKYPSIIIAMFYGLVVLKLYICFLIK